MTDFHFTSEIVVNNKKYYHLRKNKHLLLTNDNINKYHHKIGLNKIDRGWKHKINKYNDCKEVFDIYYLNTLSDGDCFFSSIADIININNIRIGNVIPMDSLDIRKEISKEITNDNFEEIMMIYRATDDFKHLWNIDHIKTHDDLKKELCTKGDNYWADHIVLDLFKQKYNMNLIILNNKDDDFKKDKCRIHCLGDILHKDKLTLILYFEDYCHFNPICIFKNNSLYSLLKYDEIPTSIIRIYENDSRKKLF